MSEFEKPGVEESQKDEYSKLHEIPLDIKNKFEGKSLEQVMMELGDRINYHTALADIMSYLDSESGKGDINAEVALQYMASQMEFDKGVTQ